MAAATSAVEDLTKSMKQLQATVQARNEPELLDQSTDLLQRTNVVLETLAHSVRQQTSLVEDANFMSEAFWKMVRTLVPLKKEVQDLRTIQKDLKLIESGLDPNPIDLPPRGKSSFSSYEELKQVKLQKSTGGSSVASSSGTASPVPSFGIRKARSDPDVNKHNQQKEIESMRVDIKRLKGSEKKLMKEKQVLGRKCKLLEEERDRAEDRLKIEQTQRDSIEKLRQRNRELEEQVRNLREKRIIKEKEIEMKNAEE